MITKPVLPHIVKTILFDQLLALRLALVLYLQVVDVSIQNETPGMLNVDCNN